MLGKLSFLACPLAYVPASLLESVTYIKESKLRVGGKWAMPCRAGCQRALCGEERRIRGAAAAQGREHSREYEATRRHLWRGVAHVQLPALGHGGGHAELGGVGAGEGCVQVRWRSCAQAAGWGPPLCGGLGNVQACSLAKFNNPCTNPF